MRPESNAKEVASPQARGARLDRVGRRSRAREGRHAAIAGRGARR